MAVTVNNQPHECQNHLVILFRITDELHHLPCQMVTHALPLFMVAIREYLDPSGRSPFGKWFAGLNAPAAAKVTTALVRIEEGNFANTRGVRAGVHEFRIDFGP